MIEIKICNRADCARGQRTLHAPKLCFVGSSHLITKFEGGGREYGGEGRGGKGAVKKTQSHPPPRRSHHRGAISTGIHTRTDT